MNTGGLRPDNKGVTIMGLFDVFSKGGKYFGKAIEPKCEYCEHGKRSSDGNKVLCTRKGMVDAGYHCPKFLYSPLKRIPVKQLERVGLLEGDYDEVTEKPRKKEEEQKPAAPAPAASAPKSGTPAPAAAAPKPVTPPPAPAQKPATPPPTPKAPAAGSDLAALAAAAEAAPEYNPEPPAEEKPAENAAPAEPAAPPTLSSM